MFHLQETDSWNVNEVEEVPSYVCYGWEKIFSLAARH